MLVRMIQCPKMKCEVRDVVLGPTSPMAAITPDAVKKITVGCKMYAGKKEPPVHSQH